MEEIAQRQAPKRKTKPKRKTATRKARSGQARPSADDAQFQKAQGQAQDGATHAPPCPAFVEPCLATLADKAPGQRQRWIHEIKFDGYRIQARLDDGKVKLLTRKGLDWTGKFPAIAASDRQAAGAKPR